MVSELTKILDDMRYGTGSFSLNGSRIKNEKELAGVLTYIVFKLIRHYYEDCNWYDKSDALKVCESAMDEFRRRFIHPYEDKKIEENGDA